MIMNRIAVSPRWFAVESRLFFPLLLARRTTRDGIDIKDIAPGKSLVTCRRSAGNHATWSFPARSDLADFDGAPRRRRTFLCNDHRFFERVAIEQEEAADHFLRFGERTVDDIAAAVAHLHARASGRRRQRFDRAEHAARLESSGKANHLIIDVVPFALGPLATRVGGFADEEHE